MLNCVPGLFVKLFVHIGQRFFVPSAVCEGNVMRGEYATGFNEALFFHRQTLCRAGIASRMPLCSSVPSGRLLHPTTNFKIQLINNLCLRWLSKKCGDLSSTKQICPVSGISELHWGVALTCSIRFNNNNYTQIYDYTLGTFCETDCVETHFSVQQVMTSNSARCYSKQGNVTTAAVCVTVHVQRPPC